MAAFILQETEQGITRGALTGRLDITGAQDVEIKFTAAVCPAGRSALIDISGVSYLSSMGIRMLIQVAKALARHNARLALYAPVDEVKAALAASGIDTLLVIADTEAQALAALR